MSHFKRINIPAIFTKGYGTVRPLDNDILKALQDLSLNLDAILTRGIRFEDNVDCRLVSVTSHATPGTEFSVAHTLGKVPVGYITTGQGAAGSVYDGTTANTSSLLYLRSDAGSTQFRLIVF